MRLIPHGDVSAALLAVTERSPVDLLWGIGGTPEGVISAAAVKCLGGQLLGRLWPRDDAEREAAVAAGYDLEDIVFIEGLLFLSMLPLHAGNEERRTMMYLTALTRFDQVL